MKQRVPKLANALPVASPAEPAAVDRGEAEKVAAQILGRQTWFSCLELNGPVGAHPPASKIEEATKKYGKALAKFEAVALLAGAVGQAELQTYTGRGSTPTFTEAPVLTKRTKDFHWGDARYVRWKAVANRLEEMAEVSQERRQKVSGCSVGASR